MNEVDEDVNDIFNIPLHKDLCLTRQEKKAIKKVVSHVRYCNFFIVILSIYLVPFLNRENCWNPFVSDASKHLVDCIGVYFWCGLIIYSIIATAPIINLICKWGFKSIMFKLKHSDKYEIEQAVLRFKLFITTLFGWNHLFVRRIKTNDKRVPSEGYPEVFYKNLEANSIEIMNEFIKKRMKFIKNHKFKDPKTGKAIDKSVILYLLFKSLPKEYINPLCLESDKARHLLVKSFGDEYSYSKRRLSLRKPQEGDFGIICKSTNGANEKEIITSRYKLSLEWDKDIRNLLKNVISQKKEARKP